MATLELLGKQTSPQFFSSSSLEGFIISEFIALFIALVAVGATLYFTKRSDFQGALSALASEINHDIGISNGLVTCLNEAAKNPAMAIPRYRNSVFEELKHKGYLRKLSGSYFDILYNAHIEMLSVDDSIVRQEDLIRGPSSHLPNADDLRKTNLVFIQQIVTSGIIPRLEQLRNLDPKTGKEIGNKEDVKKGIPRKLLILVLSLGGVVELFGLGFAGVSWTFKAFASLVLLIPIAFTLPRAVRRIIFREDFGKFGDILDQLAAGAAIAAIVVAIILYYLHWAVPIAMPSLVPSI